MPLSWNEIRHNAVKFARDHKHSTSESAEKQSFWNEFFGVFGVPRRTVASFEVPVLKTSGNFGKIDLLWKATLLVEHKSAGEDLGKAKTQAFDYIQAMTAEGRHKEVPRYVIVSDFARIVLHDLEEDTRITFPLVEFHKHIHDFAFIPGYKQHTFKEEDPINIEAAKILGELHDALETGGYTGHDLERFLVRILFCLFAEDSGIFERESFRLFIENRTAPDGSDLGLHLARLFDILNKPTDKRPINLEETLTGFPYVNGNLFSEHLGFADFNRDMRNILLACTHRDWSRISPAIFGSLFQAVMEPKERRQIGGHYTSERDILKVIRSLFLDGLRAEFESIKADRSNRRRARLEEFHEKLCRLRFLDPACGCGNFLVITYRELRQLELEALLLLFGQQTEMTLDEINRLSRVNVDQFYGIEIGEWPARIAEVALWLMDHQMNLKVSEAFGQLYQRLPLKKSPHIVCGNALRLDWKKVLPPEQCSYVLGNPPFVGKKEQNAEQKADMDSLFGNVKGAGVLDYVTGWYRKAADYIHDSRIVVGFVSTNSITQGEQVGLLWNEVFSRYNLNIHFAHRTFPWVSEARGKAHVHVVIIGFAACETSHKSIYDYEGEKVSVSAAKNINAYLADARNVVLSKRTEQISGGPEISYGSMANDRRKIDKGLGNLILDAEARATLLKESAELKPYIRPFMGSEEFLNGTQRWCLWLVDASPEVIRSSKSLLARIEAVRTARKESSRAETKELAKTPTLFGEIRQPSKEYLLVPKVSSETRPYMPVGFVKPNVIANGSALIVPNATLFHLGVFSSGMHMAWMRYTCGRMKSDYQYSSRIVYNNFPWPETATDKQHVAVEEKAKAVLAARKPHLPPHGMSTLATLYDPLSMPPELVKAHAELDRAVEKCYRPEPFHSDRERVEYLFSLYEKLTAPLLPVTPKTRGRKAKGLYSQKPAPLPQGKSTPESEAAAHFHHMMGKEDSLPYKTD